MDRVGTDQVGHDERSLAIDTVPKTISHSFFFFFYSFKTILLLLLCTVGFHIWIEYKRPRLYTCSCFQSYVVDGEKYKEKKKRQNNGLYRHAAVDRGKGELYQTEGWKLPVSRTRWMAGVRSLKEPTCSHTIRRIRHWTCCNAGLFIYSVENSFPFIFFFRK